MAKTTPIKRQPYQLLPVEDPGVVKRLRTWADYWKARPNLFNNEATRASWFMRTRRDQMVTMGALYDGPLGYLVDEALLDEALPALLHLKRVAPADDDSPLGRGAARLDRQLAAASA